MSNWRNLLLSLSCAGLAACGSTVEQGGTLSELEQVPADVEDIYVADSLERAAESYRRYLDETAKSAMTPEAMRRLADLQIEQAYGVMGSGEIVEFFGEATIAFRQMLRGRARFRAGDLGLSIEEAGADALPIISLVSLLVGLILGYIGIQQLEQFGAKLFVADLVGLATVIQMGALITAIVLAGRTGAAFAAQLGTMQVNEEIDALRTLGVSPMEFLVLPRLIALILMTPLLALYANLMGILGGALVAAIDADLTITAYLVQTQQAIGLNHVAQGLISATVYGAIVAVSGCLRGMQCGRSASSVGLATTSAVVTSIVFIVIAAAVLTIIFEAVGL